ncbi:glycoside hydrolase family 97 protein [Pseudoduganella namucuonensis]|uniref:Alpha-glucosidase n=1 Tax=Pseudoduganella namucuonensis TaxID=1035707 RepID=A0A1I7KN14_9BURK|nr:glycoside hydrolase family 97 protein [Pseudoduganella namucuonensis]SFU98800.1 alpha-glucosidase [Pseudoduganella namucuonensis]
MKGSSGFGAVGLGLALAAPCWAQTVSTVSPDGSNRVEISLNAGVPRLQISRHRETLITPSELGFLVYNQPASAQALGGLTLAEQSGASGVDEFTLPVGKTKHVKAPYRESRLTFNVKDGLVKTFTIVVRAYNDGVAFRYVLPAQPGAISIQDEATEFRFAGDYNCRGLNQGRFEHAFEGEHDAVKASQVRPFHLFQAPFVCKTGKAAFAIAESDPKIYPGAYFSGLGDAGLGLKLVLTPRKDNDPELRANTVAAKIDLSQGAETPWRVVMLGDSVGKLTESNLVNALATPSKLADTSWIQPGLSAWDWWNGTQFALPAPHNADGQRAGMNTATYKAYVDFAAELGLKYILIDEGWSVGSAIEPNDQADVTRPKPEMNMAEIIRYASAKGVGVWVWLQWRQLERQMDQALAAYERWGIKGIKVDFINRNDQEIMPFYHRLLTKTAEHKLMVDLHGAFPPAGLTRTYPHYMTQEGVLGAENNKWSRRITARHNIALAFTRGLLGPMDYTPGGFRHATPEQFPSKQRFIDPYVMTTRGAALAMYVIFESPFQMVSDSPLAYRKADGGWEDGVDFLKMVPASWDEIRFIRGDLDDHIVLARRSGDTWYVGAMTDQAKSVTVPLDFLGSGTYEARTWQDGASVSSLRTGEQRVRRTGRLRLTMAANGGAVAVIRPAAK